MILVLTRLFTEYLESPGGTSDVHGSNGPDKFLQRRHTKGIGFISNSDSGQAGAEQTSSYFGFASFGGTYSTYNGSQPL